MDNMKNNIFKYYETQCNEDCRLNKTKANSVEFLTTLKFITDLCPPGSEILDACAGTGIYAFPLAELGYKVTAGDLVEHNVEQIRKKQITTPILNQIYTGSIMDLSMFPDNSFDIVLNLGSFYHLTDLEDREKSIEESMRVLKPNGVYCMAYLNKFANYVKYNNEMNDNFAYFEKYIKDGYNEEDGLFYATTPEDIELQMPSFGLKQLYNIATDGLKFVMRNTLNSFSDSEFERWLNIHYKECCRKSLLGYSEHALYIGRKL